MPEESVTGNSIITKEFLEKSINKRIESFVVKPGSNIGDNYTSILHSLEILVENDEKGKVEAMHLLLKCYPEHPARQQLLNQSNLFLKELEVYREFVPKLEGIIPADLKDVLKSPTAGFINGDAIDYDKLNGSEHQGIDYFANYILMLDMRKTRGFKMACRYAGLDYEHSRLIVQALAKFHALSHAYQVKTKNKGTLTQQFPYLKESFVNPNMKGLLSGMLLANIGMVKNALNDFLQNNPEIENGLTKLSSDLFGCMEKYLNSESQENLANLLRINPGKGEEIQDERWTVGGHGDSWLNNMLFRYDETGNPIEAILVDLQMVREGSPLLDLTYFFYTSTTTKLRSKHLEELLTLYAESFLSYCKMLQVPPLPGFSVNEVKRRFHVAKLFGFISAIMILPIILQEKENTIDLEKMKIIDSTDNTTGEDNNISDMFSEIAENATSNNLLVDRFLGMCQELYDEGVI